MKEKKGELKLIFAVISRYINVSVADCLLDGKQKTNCTTLRTTKWCSSYYYIIIKSG